MKKILIVQHKASTFGGIWSVNSSLAKKFKELRYDVVLAAIRGEFSKKKSQGINTHIINTQDKWEVLTIKECLKLLSNFKIRDFIKSIKDNKKRKHDIKKLSIFINDYQPDYIIASHYQVLDGIPACYYKKTYLHIHSSFSDAINHKATKKELIKYNNKIGFIWLSNKAKEKAREFGLNNNICIYNFVRFETDKISDVIKNKKIVALTRLSKEKNLDIMINMLEDVFNDSKYQNWTLEIYGEGSEEQKLKSLIHSKQIRIMPSVDNVEKILLKSAINLNTSYNEGFCLSIIEGYECGVPSISFNFNEPTYEVVLDGKTGFVTKDQEDFKNKLTYLMDNSDILKKLSFQAKTHSQKFYMDNIIKDWLTLFKKIDEGEKND